MMTSQQFVVAWIEFFIVAFLLMAATKWTVNRLKQPVDRVNLIALSLVITACIPLLLVSTTLPQIRLGLVPSVREVSTVNALIERGPTPTRMHDSKQVAMQSSPFADLAVSPAVIVEPHKGDAAPSKIESSSRARDIHQRFATVGSIGNAFDIWTIAAVVLIVTHSFAIVWFFAQWLIGRIHLSKISNRATIAGLDVRTSWDHVSGKRGDFVTLLVTDQDNAPMVYGWLRPKVLIPESISSGDRETLRYCLAHEWSHVRNYDLAKWMLIQWCEIVLWFQPLFWTLRRELRVCQDLIADDYAAGLSEKHLGRIHYSELLLSIAKHSMNRQVAGALALHERSSQLSRRIKTLLTNTQSLKPRSTIAFTLLSSVVLLVVAATISSIRLSSADAQDATSDPPESNSTDQSLETRSEQEPAKFRTVRGKVVDAAGAPVPRAKLWLPLQFRPRQVVEAIADAEGNFELKIPVEQISKTSRGSWSTLWAYAPGHSIQSQNVFKALRGGISLEYTLKLPPMSNTAFRVLSPDGVPIQDVLVKPQNYKTTPLQYDLVPDEMQPLVSYRTDANGEVRLPAIEKGRLYIVELANERFGQQTMRTDGAGMNGMHEIRLRPVASIKGQLVADNPQWVRNVTLAFTTDNQNELNDTRGTAQVVTDEDGRFEVTAIASGGPLRSYVLLDPKLPVRPLLRDDMLLQSGETLELEIPLIDATMVHGRVIEKATGKGVPQAELSLSYGAYRQSDDAITDEDGNYEARTLPGLVRIQIIAMPDGLIQTGTPWTDPFHVPDNVDDFELPTIEVVGSHVVSGQLLDKHEQPLANVQISIQGGNRVYHRVETDDEGRFKLQAPDQIKTEFNVYVEQKGYVPAEVLTEEPLTLRCLHDFGMKKEVTEPAAKANIKLTGTVLASDEPEAGVSLKLHREVRVKNGATQYVETAETKTDAKGTYSLGELAPGDKYFIEITPKYAAADPTWQHQMPYIQTVPADAEDSMELPDVHLLKLNQSISGIVVDSKGKPVAGASIGLKLRTGEHLAKMTPTLSPPWTLTDGRGRFQLKELPDAPLTIMAYFANPKGGQVQNLTVQEIDKNQQNIRIVLDPTLRDRKQ